MARRPGASAQFIFTSVLELPVEDSWRQIIINLSNHHGKQTHQEGQHHNKVTCLAMKLLVLKAGKGPKTPKISALLRERPVLQRANFVLTKERERPYYGHFCGKIYREGSCSKAAGGP